MELIEIERALITKYRTKLYRPFIRALQEYDLIKENDCIAVCISGGKDSLVMAKLFQELEKYSDRKITVKYLAMNPGFNEENLLNLKTNCEKLNIPVIIKDSDVFKVATKMGGDKPCFMCAKMRRGFLYKTAQELGCNKIALAHHMNDVIETILLNVLYAGCYKTMVPKLKSQNYSGMELIRPLVYVMEKDIINYMKYIEIEAMNCGCKIASNELPSKRKLIKQMIADMKKQNSNVEMNIYRSAENINLNCALGWKHNDQEHNFLDEYDE